MYLQERDVVTVGYKGGVERVLRIKSKGGQVPGVLTSDPGRLPA